VLGETDWQGAAAAALGGDGSVAANGFWGALNMVTTLNLPMLFFIEDNRYGISVPSRLQTPGGSISANLASFQNLKVLHGDGTNPQEAWELISSAVQHVRQQGPCLLHLSVPRLSGHTFIDDQAYKSAEERAEEQRRDPVPRLKQFLLQRGCSEQDWKDIHNRVK